MAKISVPVSNDFCPQTLFLYGTYRTDGSPNFGLFCWMSYCWFDELGVMACIGGSKLTRDRIRESGVFSANLVTEEMLPLADYLGNKDGYDADKMNIDLAWEAGRQLNVPMLSQSPVSFELEVAQSIELPDSIVLLCKIRNVLTDESLQGEDETLEKKLARIAPVRTTCTTYFGWNGEALGAWGEPGKSMLNKSV